MKWRTFLLIACIGISSLLSAEGIHTHPKFADAEKSIRPNFCQIEIINNSFEDITVYGQFDDGLWLVPFYVYAYDRPQYISLFYNGYCHRDIFLDLVTFSGYHFYSGYTFMNSSIYVVPYMNRRIKAEIKRK